MVPSSAQAYDMRVTDVLYKLAQKNLTFTRATFFTTQLSQLRALGYNPGDPSMQHQGVQLTMASGDMEVPEGGDSFFPSHASVLTLEMVTSGLLSTFRTRELQPRDVHSMEEYDFDSLRPEVIANVLLDYKGMTYADVNCHAFAQNLMERILAHGVTVNGLSTRFEPRRVTRIIGTEDELSARAWALLSVALSITAAFLAAQWYYLWRIAQYYCQASGESKLQKARATGGQIFGDIQSLDAWVVGKLGENLTMAIRFGSMMVHKPLLGFYVGKYCYDNSDRIKKLPFVSKFVSSDLQEPYIAMD